MVRPAGACGTAAIQAKIEAALKTTLAQPDVQKRLKDVGLNPQWSSGKALLERVEQEQPQMRAVAARASIRAD